MQFASKPTIFALGSSDVFLKVVPQSEQVGVGSPGFTETCGMDTKRISFPSLHFCQLPKFPWRLLIPGRGMLHKIVRCLRPPDDRRCC